MKNLKFWAYVLFISLLSACSGNKSDYFRADIQNTGNYLSEPVVKEPALKWKFKTQGHVHSSVSYDNSNVFFGSEDGYFYSLDAKTGDLNWKFKTGDKILSTALIQNGNVYFLSYDGNFYSLNSKNGDLNWKFGVLADQTHQIKNYYDLSEFVPDFWDFYQSSPSFSEGVIYFGSSNIFYAVKAETGEELWNFKADDAIHSSPAISGDKVVFGSYDSRVYCLNKKSGEQVWKYETGRDTAQYVWIGVEASPMITDNKVYIGSRDANVYCFDLNTGDTLWTNDNFERSWMPSSFAVKNGKLYSGSSDGFSFYCLDQSTGLIDYTIKTNSYTFSSPAISADMAYIGSANGRLYAFDLINKEKAWEFKTEGVLTDTMKIYNDSGEMIIERMRAYLRENQVDTYPELLKFYDDLFSSTGAIVSSPVIHNRVIYFGSCDGYVYAISDI